MPARGDAVPRRVVLDTCVLVAAGFRPDSASGRLAQAVRAGRLLALWSPATRAEGLAVLGRIPPLRGLDPDGLFPPAGRIDGPLASDRYPSIPGETDRRFAALADAHGAVLVTLDAPLLDGALAHGLDARRPSQITR
ncbi:putative toxin-antitoxin system toxin component, PIN family [Rubrivirga sp. IMCC45206]|uniref:PIN domain-containing protein n=1 Tax=Rubrivirga sp. IMCC45206 TaxID=3391614 RepID=UPI00398FBA9E